MLFTFAIMSNIYLRKKISNRVLNGHPWVFSNEVQDLNLNGAAGEIADVYTHDKKFIGRGYTNPKSKIVVRLLTRDKQEEINDDFFYRRLLQAWNYRKQLGYIENCRRFLERRMIFLN